MSVVGQHERTQAGCIDTRQGLSPAVMFQSVTTSALATGSVSNHTAPANSDIPHGLVGCS